MKLVEKRVIHRFVQDIAAYEEGGEYFDKVIPLNTQAYAIYPNTNADKKGLYYVLGDDVHTYTQIRDGQGSLQSSKEYPVFNQEVINTINKKADKTYVDSEILNTTNTLNAAIEAETARATGAENAITITINDETARAVLAEDNLNTTLTSHTNNKNNPHTVTKAQIGLGNCDNTSDANKPISTATQTALNTISDDLSEEITRAKKAEGELAADLALEAERATNAEQQITTNLTGHINNKENPHVVTKAQIGLNNVDNTSDLNKPISTATQSALDSLSTEISNEVIRAKAIEEELSEDITSESLRATTAENKITSNLTAHTTNTDNPHNVTKSQIGLSNVDNTADVNKPISTATQNALNNKADKATTLAGYGITDAYTKSEIDNKISSVYKFKGSVEDVEDLPADGNTVGDVYNVIITGDNYAWTEDGWDKLAGDVDLTLYLLKTDAESTYAKISSLSTVATSGSYNDLSNKPTIPTKVSDLTNDSGFVTSSDLSTYALKSEIPVNTSELNNDSGFITSSALSGYAQTSSLAAVATSGSYNDLEDKPTIPTEYVLPTASDTVLGGVKVDGSTITATAEGVITAASATKGANFYIYGNSSVPAINPSASTTIPVSRFQNYDVNDSKLQLGDVLIDLEGTIAYVTNLNSGPSNPNMWTFNVTDDSIVIKLQTRNDENLTTTDKTIVGAINELLTKINALDARITALETPGA